jgi:hypothetical protein
MSEITTAPDALAGDPPAPVRHLRGNLGVAAIVFMVVAAAAPLGVIGGVVPLGIASGNGAGFPATFIISTAILLFFAVGFTAMTPYVDEAGAFFSYVRNRWLSAGIVSPSSRSSATWRSRRCLRPVVPRVSASSNSSAARRCPGGCSRRWPSR